MRTYHRRKSGSAIMETGPSLFLLIVFILFPMMDVMQIGCGYAFAWFLHNQELRGATVKNPPQTGVDAATTDVFTNAKSFMTYSGIQQASVVATATVTPANPPVTPVDEVTVNTNCSIKPFLTIPFFQNIPGLGAPIPLHFSSTAAREEAGHD